MLDVGFVNLVSIISQNPRVTAINSCIEVDLTGQVVSDSIGTRLYSGNARRFLLLALFIRILKGIFCNISVARFSLFLEGLPGGFRAPWFPTNFPCVPCSLKYFFFDCGVPCSLKYQNTSFVPVFPGLFSFCSLIPNNFMTMFP